MKKTIVIGVGGTGLEVIRQLRKKIVEEHKSLDAFPSLGFFFLDTDETSIEQNKDNRQKWQVLNTPISLGADEYLIIKAPAVGQVLTNRRAYPQLESWLPYDKLQASMNALNRDNPGAQQVRSLGRMIYTLNQEQIQRQFFRILNRLQEGTPGEPEVYVACSLSGGTGAGMFLDLAYSLKRWTDSRWRRTGFLVLPDMDLQAERGERYIANAYAALMELNHYSVNEQTYRGRVEPVRFYLPGHPEPLEGKPFDLCYLLSVNNEKAERISLNAIPEMIAHRMYLNFGNAAGDAIATRVHNGAARREMFLKDPATGCKYSQAFSTFGISTIQYPTEEITEILAYRLAGSMFGGWFRPTTIENVPAKVEAELPNLRISGEYLLGNLDIFDDGSNFDTIENEVRKDVTAKMQGLPPSNLGTSVSQWYGDYILTFRGGALKFYTSRSNTVDGAARTIGARVRDWLGRAITTPEQGISFAVQALQFLSDEVEKLLSGYTQYFTSLDGRINASTFEVNNTIAELTDAENRFLWRQAKIREVVDLLTPTLINNLKWQIEKRAYEYALRLLGLLRVELLTLSSSLEAWQNTVRQCLRLIDEEVTKRKKTLAALRDDPKSFNGSILFQDNQVEVLFAQLNLDNARTFVSSQVVAQQGEVLTAFGNTDQAVERARRHAIVWLSEHTNVVIKTKTVADQLFEQYPGENNPERRLLLDRTYSRSRFFLKFSQAETELLKGVTDAGYIYDPATEFSVAAMMDDENRLKNVTQLRSEVAKAANIPVTALITIEAGDQIQFVHERSAFPLRLIEDAALLRERYRRYSDAANSLPLLVTTKTFPPIQDLFYLSPNEIERIERAEEDFLVGRTLGIIRAEASDREKRVEIRYVYREEGAERYQMLGLEWGPAFEFWMSDEPTADAGRVRMKAFTDKLFDKLDGQRERTELGDKLYWTLEQIKNELKFGAENPVYERWVDIYKRVVRKRRLAREDGSAPSPPPAAVAPASAPPAVAPVTVDGSQYERLFESFAMRTGGKLSDAMRSSLKSTAQRLGIGDAQADEIQRTLLNRLGLGQEAGEYRQLFESLAHSGAITEQDRILLDEQAAAMGLTMAQTQAIEMSVQGKAKSVN